MGAVCSTSIAPLVTRLMFLGKRLEKIHGHLAAREDKQDAGSRKLLAGDRAHR